MIDYQQKDNALARPDFPNTILSLHVNHDLQSDAEKMAYAAGKAATRFNALHSELRVPWGEPPFPRRPRMGARAADADAGAGAGAGAVPGGEAIESVARTARYRLMFDAMTLQQQRQQQQRRADVLATGHHADDQIETVLMRLGSGSSVLGLGGMRPVRRFGMAMGKNESDFGWFGHEGLDRWIVRPLLDVPKVRIFYYRVSRVYTRVCVFFFRTEFSRLASCIRFAMSSTAPISNRTSRYAMPFAI
jgi:tRNA(Ile)-lysidine synthase